MNCNLCGMGLDTRPLFHEPATPTAWAVLSPSSLYIHGQQEQEPRPKLHLCEACVQKLTKAVGLNAVANEIHNALAVDLAYFTVTTIRTIRTIGSFLPIDMESLILCEPYDGSANATVLAVFGQTSNFKAGDTIAINPSSRQEKETP